MARVDPTNVQGLVFHPYRYPFSRHLLFSVESASAARAWLRLLAARVTHAGQPLAENPEPLLNVGVTWRGLEALGLLAKLGGGMARKEFPDAFISGPPAAISGTWKGKFSSADVHLTLHIHTRSLTRLEEASTALRSLATGAVRELKPVPGSEGAITGALFDGPNLHFGFRDGISHPDVNWEDAPGRANAVDLRHFVLGQWRDDVQSHPKSGFWGDFVRDSSYGAFQWIKQNVIAFEDALTEYAKVVAPELTEHDARELVAAKMMGRWRDGTPLALSPNRPDSSLSVASDFGYGDDPKGDKCPLTAHVRIANRRDQPLEPLVESSFSNGGPLLLRRGMPYGPAYQNIDDGIERGLVGIFICSNLQNQFLTMMNWMNKADFSPLFNPRRLGWQDMIAGDRKVASEKRRGAIRRSGGETILSDLPAFVEIQGTLMLLIPSMKTLFQMTEPSI